MSVKYYTCHINSRKNENHDYINECKSLKMGEKEIRLKSIDFNIIKVIDHKPTIGIIFSAEKQNPPLSDRRK